MRRWLFNLPTHYRWALFAGIPALIEGMWILVSGIAAPGVDADFANKDFANYWIAGRLVLDGGTADLFGPQSDYFLHMLAAFGPDYDWHNWSYPPHYLLFVWPLGFFGYKAAMILFLGTTLLVFLWGVRQISNRQNVVVWIAIIPFVGHNILCAQNGYLFGGLALAALGLRDRNPIVAGIFLGILTIKPQLGILFPFLLLAERRWLVIASTCVTTLSLVAASAALFDIDAWRGYLAEVVPYQSLVMNRLEGTFLSMLPSTFGMFRNWGLDANIALLMHLVVSIPVAVVTIFAFFVVKLDEDRTILLLVATFIVTPYALSYDLGMFVVGVGLLATRPRVLGSRACQMLLVVSMLLPAIMMSFGRFHITIAPAIIIGVYLLALQESGVFAHTRLLWKELLNRSQKSPFVASD